MSQPNSVVFFDGVCNLCNQSINILLKIDSKKEFKYSSLQGRFAKSILDGKNINTNNSFVYFLDGKIYTKSEAVVQALKKLGGAYSLLGHSLSVFSYSFLDIFYDLIAKNRYKLFGKREQCRIPSNKEAHFFIE